MKKLIKSKLFLQVIVASMVATLATAGIVGAVTTIGDNITTAGTLAVTGASALTGNLAVDTNILLVDVTNNKVGIGTTTPFATLSVNNVAGQNAFVIGSSTATWLKVDDAGLLTVAKGATFSSTLAVTGATTLSSTLTVTGLATFNGNATTTQLTVSGPATLYGATSIGGALTATSTLAVSGDFNVNGKATTTAATGNITTMGKIGIASTSPWAMLSVGPIPTVSSATSTIDFSKPCFKMAAEDGSVLYLYLKLNANAYSNWATSTTSCF